MKVFKKFLVTILAISMVLCSGISGGGRRAEAAVAESDASIIQLSIPSLWKSGDLDTENGKEIEHRRRIHLSELREINFTNASIHISLEGYLLRIFQYDEEGNFLGYSAYSNGDKIVIFDGATQYDIVLNRIELEKQLSLGGWWTIFNNGLEVEIQIQDESEKSEFVEEYIDLNAIGLWKSGDIDVDTGEEIEYRRRIHLAEKKIIDFEKATVCISSDDYGFRFFQYDSNGDYLGCQYYVNGEEIEIKDYAVYYDIVLNRTYLEKQLSLGGWGSILRNELTVGLKTLIVEVYENESSRPPQVTSTPTPTATNTPTPTATNTPTPTATNTPTPTATNTPTPTATNTPTPTATNTPKPTATSTPMPADTGKPKDYASCQTLEEVYLLMLENGEMGSVDISRFNASYDTISKAWNNVIQGEGRIAYESGNSLVTKSVKQGKKIVSTSIAGMDVGFCERYALVQQSVNEALALIQPGMNDVEKALTLHDYVVDKATYVSGADGCYKTWGIMAYGKGVCMSYSAAYVLLLNLAGIETSQNCSDDMNHIWTVVKLDGKWYQVDPTWDDTQINSTGKHYYFLRTGAEFENSLRIMHYNYRTYGATTATIQCNDTRFTNWFVHDIKGNMAYLDGYWYYADGTKLMKARIDGSEMQVVTTENATVTVIAAENEMISYKVGNSIKTIK